jgi:hypothetical protein
MSWGGELVAIVIPFSSSGIIAAEEVEVEAEFEN